MKPFLTREFSAARRVLALAGRERAAVALVVGLGLVAAVFEGVGLSFPIPLVHVATGETTDPAIPVIGPVLGWLDGFVDLSGVHIVALVIGFFILGIVVTYLNLVVSTMLAMRFAHRLRTGVFETALQRPLSAIENLPAGTLVNTLATETWNVCDALFVIVSVVVQAVACAVLLVFLFLLSPFYTLVLLGMTVLMALVVHLATRAVRGIGAQAVAAYEGFMARVWDALGGLRVIRGFGREEHERARFAASSGRVRDIFTRMQILTGLVGPITQVLTVAMVGVILAIALLRGDPFSTLVGFLAIAVCTRNRAAMLRRCLQTLVALRDAQGSGAVEILVVDNAPPDDSTRAAAAEFEGGRYAMEPVPGPVSSLEKMRHGE